MATLLIGGRGEIGRHAGFRSRCSKECEGSSPSARISRARATIARQFLRAVGLPRIEAPTIDAETAARFKAAADRSLDTGETPATSPRCRSCSGSQKGVGSSFTARSVTTSMSSSPFAGRVTRRPSETSRPLQPEPPEFGVLDWAHWVAPKPVPASRSNRPTSRSRTPS